MWIRLIIYIDDILIMAELETLLKDHTAGIIYLLENSGFVINFPTLKPTKTIEFFRFLLDSPTMELKLPGDKIKAFRERQRGFRQLTHNSPGLIKMNATTETKEGSSDNLPLISATTSGASNGTEQILSELWSSHMLLGVGEGRASVVDNPPNELEWAEFHRQETQCFTGDGCLTNWLGSSMRGSEDGGPLVEIGTKTQYKLPGTTGCIPGLQMLLQE